MQNFYSNSENIKKKAFSIADDDDEDDYENVSDVNQGPAVPARGKKTDVRDKVEDLNLKCLNKHVRSNQNGEHLNVITGTRPGSSLQPPPIGLDFSSPAVNAAFRDLPDSPSKEKNPRLGWLKLAFMAFFIFIFLVVILITSIIFLQYSKISSELADIKLNVSERQETTIKERMFWAAEVRQINQTLRNEIDNIRTEMQAIKRYLGLCTVCPPEWILLGTTCYYVSKSHHTWEGSKLECIRRDSSFLVINSRKELDSLLPLTGNKRFWIGLRKVDNREWKWVDGKTPTFTNWNPNEPNNYNYREHCTEMITGGWNDLDCSNTIDYICERLSSC